MLLKKLLSGIMITEALMRRSAQSTSTNRNRLWLVSLTRLLMIVKAVSGIAQSPVADETLACIHQGETAADMFKKESMSPV